MEIILYLLSNWCATGAAVILLWHCVVKPKIAKKNDSGAAGARESTEGDGPLISQDLQIMLMLGSLSRVYWSCSPPPVWSQELLPLQWVSIVDVATSPIIWIAVFVFVGLRQQSERIPPRLIFQWPVWTVAAVLFSVFGETFVPPSGEGWPFDGCAILFNMVIDGFAMIPQMHMISKSNKTQPPEASHFIGLLSLSRVLRMLFWFVFYLVHWWETGGHGFVWTFVVPDLIHSCIMGQFLWIWMKKVKRDTIDPYLEQMHHV